MKDSPTNTTKTDPMLALAEAMIFGSSRSIEMQESRGQKELVESQVLPTEGLDKIHGIVIGDKVPGDPMFTYVTLPEGWKKESTDHSMWSSLVDDKGRVRASIFYKAAFYDRSAFIRPTVRYGIDCYVPGEGKEKIVSVTDCGKPIHEIGRYTGYEYSVQDALRDRAKEYLDQTYPGWNDANAYWD